MADKEFKVKHGIAMGDGVIKFDAETGAWQLSADGSTFYSVASASTSLDGLSDVSAENPSDGQFLKYDSASAQWVPANIPTINNLDDVGDVTITTAQNGQFLKWNGSAWVNDVIDLGTDTSGNYIVDVTGGAGVSVSHTPGEGSNPTISIGQDVGTSASVTFGNVNTSGDVTVGGNLTVNGTTTTVNTETINLADNTITLNSNETGAPTQNAGIEVERGTSANVQLRWNETTDKWEVTNDGSEYNEIVDLHLLNTKIAEEHYHRSVWLLSTIPLSGSPTYTPGSLDEDGGYGIGATLSSSVNETLEVDGETPYVGARIGVFGQSNAIHNGIYVVTSVGSVSTAWTLTRADDANGSFPEQLKRGETIPVAWGNANIIQAFGISSDGSAPNGGHIFGTDEITVVQVSGTAQLVKGNGIDFSGNIVSVVVAPGGGLINDSSGLNISSLSASVTTGAQASEFVRTVALDSYGRVVAYETAEIENIALGSKTTGDYVERIIEGTGISLIGATGPSASVTVSTVQDISTSSSVEFSLLTLNNLNVSSSVSTTDFSAEFADITYLTSEDIYSASVDAANATIFNLSATSASAQNFYGDLTGDVVGGLTGNVFGDVTGNVTGNLLGNVTGNLSGSASFAEEAEQLSNARLITLSGDVVGSAFFDGTENITIATTVASNSVQLGADTTGNYVSDVSAGTGVTVTHTPGEGSTATVAIGQNVSTSSSVTFAHVSANLTGNVTGNVSGNSGTASALENPVSISLSGDVSGSVSFDGSSNATITTSIQPNSVALGVDTTGNYVSDVQPGTGISVSHTPGEGSSASISLSASLDDLDDVASSSPSDGQFLKYVSASSVWVPANIPTINNLDDVGDVSTSSASVGQFLKWNGSEWINDSIDLGADTFGDYVANVVAGAGMSVTHIPGAGSSATVDLDAGIGELKDVFTNIDYPIDGDFFKYSSACGGWIPEQINLGSDTVGDYVQNLSAGTGVTITNNSGEGSTPTVEIGQDVATSASPVFYNLETTHNLIVGGNLLVSGSVQTVNQSVLQIDDSFVYLNYDDEQGLFDLGIGGNYNDGSYKHTGIFRDATDGKWKFFDDYQPDIAHPVDVEHPSFSWAPVVAETFESKIATGSAPFIVASTTEVANLHANTATSLHTARAISLGGDVSGSVSFDGSADVSITATIQANSVTLGVDTTGNYVSDITGGTGVTVTHTPGEGSSPTIAIGQSVSTSSSPTFSIVSVSGTPTESNHVATVDYVNTQVAGATISTLDDVGDVEITSVSSGQFLKWNGSVWVNDAIDLGTDTTGNYMSSISAGTGISITHTPGEGSSASVALNASLDDLNNVSAAAPSDGQILKYVSASAAWVAQTVASGGATISTTPPSSPNEGQIWFESDTLKTYIYYDSFWVEIISGSSPASLSDIGNVDTTGLGTGDRISYNGTTWVATPVSDANQIIAMQVFN